MKRYGYALVIGMLTFALSGCASAYKSYTSGQIGCAEKDIEVKDLDQGMFNTTWTATCKGKNYFCSRTGGSGTTVKQVSCKEAQ